MSAPDNETLVRGLLAAGGLSLTDEQVAKYVAIYPIFRAAADRLLAMPELRDQVPDPIFRAQCPPQAEPPGAFTSPRKSKS